MTLATWSLLLNLILVFVILILWDLFSFEKNNSEQWKKMYKDVSKYADETSKYLKFLHSKGERPLSKKMNKELRDFLELNKEQGE